VKNEAQHETGQIVPQRVELPIDVRIAALADRQHGVVGLRQLGEMGLSASGVRKRVARGNLHRIHRGVYAVGRSKLTGRGHWMAAVLACGPRAALSHRSGAGLAGLLQDNSLTADVSLPSPSARPRTGIEVPGSITLTAEGITTVDGIPCTTVARTLVDLGDVVPRRAVEKAVEQG
jgi:predicted transcriptional regulator of viral defense system